MNLDATIWRRLAVYLPGLFVAAFVQTLPNLSSALISPDLLFLFPLLAGLWTGGYDGFVTGMVAGFLRDYMAGRGYGMGMLAGMFIGLITGLVASEGWQQYALRGRYPRRCDHLARRDDHVFSDVASPDGRF